MTLTRQTALPAVALLLLGTTLALAGSRPALRPTGPDGRAHCRTVRLPAAGREQIRELTRLGFDLEGGSPGNTIAHVTFEEEEKLDALGVAWLPVPQPGQGATSEDASSYHDYASMTAVLQQVALDHPQITRLVSAGTSAQGRELWWMRITDSPDLEEDEPGFKYIATMHGDEKVGTENCLRLIEELTDRYGTDPRLTRLVDEVEIWIMPLMNPDGHTLGQRYNANGSDLNRDFPDRLDDPSDTLDGRQPETQALMTWQATHTTTLSANFHGGAVVVNYPYDNNESKQTVYTATPDDDIIVDLSLEYSEDNGPMYTGAWPQGITNGAEWYVVAGGMQDWNYDYQGDIETTIELSDVKTPAANRLEQFWADNRESMLSYMERALTGVRGVVTDRDTGTPIPARLEVAGRGAAFYADPEVGDYHRPMPAGTFDLIVAAPGYETEVVPFTIVDPTADAVRRDVTLQALPTRLEQVAHRVAQDTDGDGFLCQGENGRLAVTLENEGAAASGIEGELLALTPHASPAGTAEWPPLAPGVSAESQSPHFEIQVAPDTPPGHKLGFAVAWQTAEGPAGTSSAFFVPVGPPGQRQESSTDPPLSIDDHSTVESSITVTEDEELAELNVRVDISHTYIGDLRVTLIAPDGTELRLHDRAGGSADDIRTWYDTETSPADSLEALVGRPSAGTWTLRVEDEANGDQGILEGWSLERFGRPWEDPVAEVLLRDVARIAGGDVRLEWWLVGSASSYRVYRSNDPSSVGSFVEVTGNDPDATDTLFEDSSGEPLSFWIVSAEGHTGEGLWGHFER